MHSAWPRINSVVRGETWKPKQPFKDARSAERDAELVVRCRRGDQTAWDELVDRFQRLVYSIPLRAGLDEDQAADIFQEVFITLLEKIDEIEQPDRLSSWLVTVAKFKTWAAVRSRKGHVSSDSEDGPSLEVSGAADLSPLADDVLIELEEQHLIRTAVAELDERCRKMIMLLYLSEPSVSYAEVAREIGVADTSISPLRARCLKKLAKRLG